MNWIRIFVHSVYACTIKVVLSNGPSLSPPCRIPVLSTHVSFIVKRAIVASIGRRYPGLYGSSRIIGKLHVMEKGCRFPRERSFAHANSICSRHLTLLRFAEIWIRLTIWPALWNLITQIIEPRILQFICSRRLIKLVEPSIKVWYRGIHKNYEGVEKSINCELKKFRTR